MTHSKFFKKQSLETDSEIIEMTELADKIFKPLILIHLMKHKKKGETRKKNKWDF